MKNPFTETEEQFIKDNYLLKPMKAIARLMNRSAYGTGYHAIKVLKLTVPDEIKKQFKKQYKPNHVPFVKGKTIDEFMSAESIESFKKHWFKKGDKPKKTLYDGAVTIRINKRSGIPYKWKRVKGVWIQLSRHIWIEAGNTIPKGFILVFKTTDTLNCSVENIECISRADNLKRNRDLWIQQPPSIRYDAGYKLQCFKVLNKKRNQDALRLRDKIKKSQERKARSLVSKQNKENDLIAKKVLKQQKSVSRKDEINWSKKYLSNTKFRIADTSNLIPVRVDKKTILYLKPGSDIDKIKERYQRNIYKAI